MEEEWAAGRRRYESEGGVLDRSDTGIETARVKLASAEVRIVRAANYARVVEDALRRTPGNAELEEELGRSRDELAASRREKDELEAEQRLAEAVYRRAFYAKEQREDRRERATFGRIARWQHAATYLLYFVMLMNVFITTFGISGGKHDTVIRVPRPEVIAGAATSGHVATALTSSEGPEVVATDATPGHLTTALTSWDGPEVVAAAATSGHVDTALTLSTLSTSTSTMKYDLPASKYDVIISDHSSIGNASYLRLHD